MFCSYPGMRDTNEVYGTLDNLLQNATRKLWPNLSKLPWASEKSPHAKVVRNNKLLKLPPEVNVIPRKKEPIWLFKELWNLQKQLKEKMKIKTRTVKIKKEIAVLQGKYMRMKRDLEEKKHIEIIDRFVKW